MDDDKLLPFPAAAQNPAGPATPVEISADEGIRIRVPGVGAIDWDDLKRETEAQRRETERLRSSRLEPDADLKLTIASLMEVLADVRERLNLFDRTGQLRRRYEALRCALSEAGFPVRHESRFARAAAHRRLGELAEERGDLQAALLHYELAVRARKDVGCRRALDRLRRDVVSTGGD